MADEIKSRPKYQTQHFEAVPYVADNYVLVWRDSDGRFACGRTFPDAVARTAVEALEHGFHHGVMAAIKHAENMIGQSMTEHFRQMQHSPFLRPIGPPEIVPSDEET